MLVDNRAVNADGTPDVIGFLIFDRSGRRVAYGTGQVVKGNVSVGPSRE